MPGSIRVTGSHSRVLSTQKSIAVFKRLLKWRKLGLIRRADQNALCTIMQAEQLHYLETTKDEGNRRLDWRFAT